MTETSATLWDRVVDSRKEYDTAAQEFLSQERERLTVLRKALASPERNTALWVARSLKTDELERLLPELVQVARSVHGPFEAAWNLILSLPRGRLLEQIEPEFNAILKEEQEDDYWMLLQLAERLDPELTSKIARRALVHSNPEIRELGEEYAQKCDSRAATSI